MYAIDEIELNWIDIMHSFVTSFFMKLQISGSILLWFGKFLSFGVQRIITDIIWHHLLFTLQIYKSGSKMKEGDVILSNHPCAGGSHLPDLTVITPVRYFTYQDFYHARKRLCSTVEDVQCRGGIPSALWGAPLVMWRIFTTVEGNQVWVLPLEGNQVWVLPL